MRGAAASGAVAFLIVAVSRTMPSDVRVWLPLLYLPIGYWMPAMLTPAPEVSRFEAWLREHDTEWRRLMRPLPPAALFLLELAYLAVYVVVPLAFVTVWLAGTAEDVSRFWVAVLLSGFACYITLPWLVSRPPRIFDEGQTRPPGLASFNVSLLSRVSHQLNTFPSGHVAVATAIALTVFSVSLAAGILFGTVAVGIAVGAAAGRYHYGIDVLAGALVGIVAVVTAVL